MSREPMSRVRKIYFARLVGRCVVLLIAVALWLFRRESFNVLNGMNFFRGFSIFHLLWILWLIDMFCQLVPVKGYISLGSHKHFLARFKPIAEKINKETIKKHVRATTKAAYKVMVIWVALVLRSKWAMTLCATAAAKSSLVFERIDSGKPLF